MTNEQREAVEKLKNGEKMDFTTLVRTFKKEGTEKFAVVRKEYLDTVLSLIKEQNKIINYMANFINDNTPYTKDTKELENELGIRTAEFTEQYFAGLVEKE